MSEEFEKKYAISEKYIFVIHTIKILNHVHKPNVHRAKTM